MENKLILTIYKDRNGFRCQPSGTPDFEDTYREIGSTFNEAVGNQILSMYLLNLLMEPFTLEIVDRRNHDYPWVFLKRGK